jgi:hypothetical protein
MIEDSLAVQFPGVETPRNRWARMDQLLERGMVTAPRETATPITPARRAARMTIHKIHLLKVQRDI